MKLFECNYKIVSGGGEGYGSILTYQNNIRGAVIVLHRYLRGYYDDGDTPTGGDGGYFFGNYTLFAKPLHIEEVTKQEWMENEFNNRLYQ